MTCPFFLSMKKAEKFKLTSSIAHLRTSAEECRLTRT